MSKSARGEEQLAVYSEEFCPIAELLYKFAVGVSGSAEASAKFVEKAYAKLAQDFDQLAQTSEPKKTVFKLGWENIQFLSSSSPKAAVSDVAAFLSKLSFNDRCNLVLADFIGFLVEEIVSITGKDEADIRISLATARQKLVEQF